MSVRIIAWLGTAWLAASPCAAQGVGGDPAAGRDIAGKLCSICHATDPDGAGITRADVPSFRRIANVPTMTPDRLAIAIIIPHPEMPGVPLTRTEIRDIISYIVSLRTQP